MTNVALLKEAVNESGMTKKFIANKMGCCRARLYKILEGDECKVSEMMKLSEILRLSAKQQEDIFLK